MPKLTIIYWRDIPAQVIGQQGRTRHKQELDRRFAVAIDRGAKPGPAQAMSKFGVRKFPDPKFCQISRHT
jgi:hypothetical protein